MEISEIKQTSAGVYFLFDKGTCVYIGESLNIPGRIRQHILEGTKVFDEYKFFFCEDRKLIESKLIQIFSPKYNIQFLKEKKPVAKTRYQAISFIEFKEWFKSYILLKDNFDRVLSVNDVFENCTKYIGVTISKNRFTRLLKNEAVKNNLVYNPSWFCNDKKQRHIRSGNKCYFLLQHSEEISKQNFEYFIKQ